MAGFNERIERANVPIPVTEVTEVIQEAAQQSVMLQRGRRVNMSTKVQKQPVLATLPEAYWVNGDTGLKQTTSAEWSQLTMTAEEVAVLLPIPDAVIDDSSVPLWAACRPLLAEAIGKKVDQATLFGVDRPASFPQGVVPSAIAAGNVVRQGTGADLAVDVANLAGLVARDGFAVNGFASGAGLQWELVGLRSNQGAPIYTPSLSVGAPSGLYGYPLNEVATGAWSSDSVKLLAADWSKFVVGVRQDMTYDLFDQMVITDDTGKVIFNAPQQDSKVMRVVFRVGFQVANPLTRLNGNEASRYPAGVLTPPTVGA